MAVTEEKDLRSETLYQVGRKMLLAARTAPKACGIDNFSGAIVTGDDILALSEKLAEMGKAVNKPFFMRDAENIKQAGCIVLLGTRLIPQGLNCGLCGFDTCAAKPKAVPCAFNTGDLGIAVGAAASVAMDCRADNRIMYTVGRAAVALNLLGPDVKIIFGIPLSSTGKNPFFDRK